MLDIVKKLNEGEPDVYKNETLQALQEKADELKKELDLGVDPIKYKQLSKHLSAIKLSIGVLSNYQSN